MKRFERSLIQSHFAESGDLAPEFIGSVDLEEPFIVETENSNDANGPVAVEGIRAGDNIAVQIEDIEIVGPIIAPNGGPFDVFDSYELELKEGYLHFPAHFKIKPRPTLGNVAVLPNPAQTEAIMDWAKNLDLGSRIGYPLTRWRQLINDPRGKHCHQDCPWLGPGTTIHLKAQVDGAGVCMADFHAYMGEGEMSFNGVSSAANVRAKVVRSTEWIVDWPVIETAEEVMVVRTGDTYVQVVREAFKACRDLVRAKTDCSLAEANSLVASVMDLRNCAIYGLGNGYIEGREEQPSRDLSVVGVIPKDVFV